jgi:hypothetical protein
MEVRLVKEELNKCYRGEGVNAPQFCKELAERYVGMLKDNKVSRDASDGADARCKGLWRSTGSRMLHVYNAFYKRNTPLT